MSRPFRDRHRFLEVAHGRCRTKGCPHPYSRISFLSFRAATSTPSSDRANSRAPQSRDEKHTRELSSDPPRRGIQAERVKDHVPRRPASAKSFQNKRASVRGLPDSSPPRRGGTQSQQAATSESIS